MILAGSGSNLSGQTGSGFNLSGQTSQKFENRIRIHAKTPDPTGSGSATLLESTSWNAIQCNWLGLGKQTTAPTLCTLSVRLLIRDLIKIVCVFLGADHSLT